MPCPAYTGLLWCRRQPHAARNGIFVRFPLRLSHPGLGGDIMISHSQGSFQRDSAGAGHGCHRFFASLYDRLLCRLEGATLRPSLSGGFQPCGILHTVGAAAAPPPPPPCEGGRNEIKWERRAYTPTLPFSHIHLALVVQLSSSNPKFLATALINCCTHRFAVI